MHFSTILPSILALAAVSKAAALPAAGPAEERALEERNPFDPFGLEKRAATLSLNRVATTLSLGRTPIATSTSTSTRAATPTNSPPNAWATGILNAHNTARKSHAANALVWNDELTGYAKIWAEKCIWEHGQPVSISLGQNLAAGASSASVATQSGQTVVDMWMAEEKDYNPQAPMYSHFTQVVWKATTELGCYQAQCPNSKFKDGKGQLVFNNSRLVSVAYTVCNYRRAGNVQGQYADNVTKIL